MAEVPMWRTVGELLVWMAAVVAAIGIISRARPVKWMWRQIIGDPVTRWGHRVVGEVVEAKLSPEFNPNGGASLRDAVDNLAEGHGLILGELEGQGRRLGNVEASVTRLQETIDYSSGAWPVNEGSSGGSQVA